MLLRITSLALLFIILLNQQIYSQLEEAKDKILLVPYKPSLYINYEEKTLVKENDKSSQYLRNFFRTSLNELLLNDLNADFLAKSILQDYTLKNDNSEEIIYSRASFYYDDAKSFNKPNISYNKQSSKLTKEGPKNRNAVRNGEVNDVIADDANMFMNVKFREKEEVLKILREMRADYILFISQFELRADYSNPYNVNSNNYKRKIKLHFTLLDKKLKYKTGGFVIMEFSSSKNDLNEIEKEVLASLSKELVKLVKKKLGLE